MLEDFTQITDLTACLCQVPLCFRMTVTWYVHRYLLPFNLGMWGRCSDSSLWGCTARAPLIGAGRSWHLWVPFIAYSLLPLSQGMIPLSARPGGRQQSRQKACVAPSSCPCRQAQHHLLSKSEAIETMLVVCHHQRGSAGSPQFFPVCHTI